MWISRKEYDRIMERLGDLERFVREANNCLDSSKFEARELRAETSDLKDQFRVLVASLGLVYRHTPAKEEYVKKGGPERG